MRSLSWRASARGLGSPGPSPLTCKNGPPGAGTGNETMGGMWSAPLREGLEGHGQAAAGGTEGRPRRGRPCGEVHLQRDPVGS